ncbi:GroES-like protein [Lentinula novae-zelandiae]|nr:GroES-like protein [Lentinula novae-zelandiae]
MAEQKALQLEKAKGSFVISTVPILKPGPGQLSVKVITAALNPADWKLQTLGVFIQKYPAVLGTDITGDVEDVGEGVEGFSKGDKIPSNIDYAQAATIPLGFTSAAVGLLREQPGGAGLNPNFDLKVNLSGQSAIVVGGSTSVGQYAIQLLRLLGYNTIIAYASARHADYLKSIGATDVIDRAEVPADDLAEAAKKIANAPIKIAFNAVGDKDSRTACIDAIVEGGQVADVNPQSKDVDPGNGKRIFPIFGGSHHPPHKDFNRILWKTLPKLVQEEKIVPNRVEKLPNGLAGIDEGLQRLKAGKVSGVKLVAFPQETA